MDYEKKINGLQNHLRQNPKDYQAVIGLLKARSDAIEHEIHEAKIERLKKVAKYRREYNEKQALK